MDRQRLVIQILEEQFPDECEIVGPANVRHLANGAAEMVHFDHASNLDLSEVLADLREAAEFATGAIGALQTYVDGRKEKLDTAAQATVEPSRPPECQDGRRERLDVATAQQVVEPALRPQCQLAPEQRDAILGRIVQWVNDDPDALQPAQRGVPSAIVSGEGA